MVLMLDIYIVNTIINYNKYRKTGDLDIVDKIKLRGLLPKNTIKQATLT
jgi:hypothetical protein